MAGGRVLIIGIILLNFVMAKDINAETINFDNSNWSIHTDNGAFTVNNADGSLYGYTPGGGEDGAEISLGMEVEIPWTNFGIALPFFFWYDENDQSVPDFCISFELEYWNSDHFLEFGIERAIEISTQTIDTWFNYFDNNTFDDLVIRETETPNSESLLSIGISIIDGVCYAIWYDIDSVPTILDQWDDPRTAGNYTTTIDIEMYNTGSASSEVIWFPVIYQAVPIPSALWLLGSGLIGLVGFRKKFRKS